MRRRGDRHQFRDPLHDPQYGDLGITQRHETGVDTLRASISHFSHRAFEVGVGIRNQARQEYFGEGHYRDFGGAASLKCKSEVEVLLHSHISDPRALGMRFRDLPLTRERIVAKLLAQ
jgi:hypothetical protein